MERVDRTYFDPDLSGRNFDTRDEIRDKRLELLKAYRLKGSLKKSNSEATLRRMKSESQIFTLSPIKVPLHKKFSHSPAPSMNGDFGKPPIIKERWWTKDLTKPGEAMNTVQKRLSDVDNFTGSVKHNFHHFRREAKMRGVAFEDNIVDPFVPDEANHFIQKSSSWRHDQAMMGQRQGDLMTEAIFRSTLRSD